LKRGGQAPVDSRWIVKQRLHSARWGHVMFTTDQRSLLGVEQMRRSAGQPRGFGASVSSHSVSDIRLVGAILLEQSDE
jgi:hypothetical protein